MNEIFLVRIFAYSALPLLLALGHILLDQQSQTPARRIEVITIYLLAISVGANGLGGAFGHLFLSDLVAEGIGWSSGSPFQLEMGFANLALGILGLEAIGRRDGFRSATIIATTVIGVGATYVHLREIALHGNLSPGNTIQNIGNLLDPILLIALSWKASHLAESNTSEFMRWHMRQQSIPSFAAAGVGIGFGIGYATGNLLIWVLIGTLVAVGIGIWTTLAHQNELADISTQTGALK